MNFLRSRLCAGSILGQTSRQIVQKWSRRWMCNKQPEIKADSLPAAPATHTYKIPGFKPTEMDKRILIWSGRFKTQDQIPEYVSIEMLDGARNRMRVKVCYAMMAATVVACVLMVILGKQAAARHETLTSLNMQKKAKWREEVQREKEAAVALSEKAQ